MKRVVFFVGLFLAMYGLGLDVPATMAQPYPSRPIQLIIPNVPGSIMDVNARIVSDDLGKILGTQIIPINKPGAATTLGTDAVVRSKKDGYTLGYIASSSLIYTRITNPETVPYDPDRDLEPLGLHCFFPMVVAVQESSPWKTFGELVDYARKNPEKLRVSTIGVGSIDHFNVEVTQATTGARFTHVPFKGGESVLAALLGGHVEVAFDALGKVIPHVNAGKLRILLIARKVPDYPNIPTLTELGYQQGLFSFWFAFYGPAGLPEEIKKVLVPAIEKVIKQPDLKAKVDKLGFLVNYKSPAELNKLRMEDYETANAIAIKLGLRK